MPLFDFWPLWLTTLFNGVSVDFFGFSYLPLFVSFNLFFLLTKLSRLFYSKRPKQERKNVAVNQNDFRIELLRKKQIECKIKSIITLAAY